MLWRNLNELNLQRYLLRHAHICVVRERIEAKCVIKVEACHLIGINEH